MDSFPGEWGGENRGDAELPEGVRAPREEAVVVRQTRRVVAPQRDQTHLVWSLGFGVWG